MVPTRRAIVALMALAVAPLPLAQQAGRVHRVGFLIPRSSAFFGNRLDAFRSGMGELGYVEGKDLVIEWRFADGQYDRLPALARELVQSKVDVIVADSTPGVQAVRAASATIPVVMVSVGDPVVSGFVKSLSRPGGNVTGLSNVTADVSSKYVDLLREAMPGLTRIAVLVNPDNSNHGGIAGRVQAAAKTKDMTASIVSARTPAEIDAVFAGLGKDRVGALVVMGDPFFGQQARQLGELTLKYRVVTLATNRSLAEAGGLLSYGQDLVEHYRRAAAYTDKILKGAKPSDLPVEQSTKIELVVNERTAKALGIAIPPPLLLRANDVIR